MPTTAQPQTSTMFLVKGDVLLGRCVEYSQGWRFLPNVSNHQPSRRYWPSANACIPKWAFNLSDDFLTAEEWKRRSTVNA